MTLETAFFELDARFAGLEQALDNLLWAVVQGQPPGNGGHALIDHYDASAIELMGLVKAARAAAADGNAPEGRCELGRARRALATAQEQYNFFAVRFYADPNSFERRNELHNLKRKGGEWSRWVQGIDDALSHCPQPIYDVSQALLRCWQALIERAGALALNAQIERVDARITIAQMDESQRAA